MAAYRSIVTKRVSAAERPAVERCPARTVGSAAAAERASGGGEGRRTGNWDRPHAVGGDRPSPARLPACPPARLPACPPARLPAACVLTIACLLACLPSHLLTCLHTCCCLLACFGRTPPGCSHPCAAPAIAQPRTPCSPFPRRSSASRNGPAARRLAVLLAAAATGRCATAP